MPLNLPNAITAVRIVLTPLIAVLAVSPSWRARAAAWALFIAASVTDYWDGKLARERNLVTDLGRLLDPLADKLLLIFTLGPMWWLTRGASLLASNPGPDGWAAGDVVGPVLVGPLGTSHIAHPFVTPVGLVGLPFWILAVIIGREIFMTVFRQIAAHRGVIISAIGPAKWKTIFQWIWVGAAFFWYSASAIAVQEKWTSVAWRFFAHFNGVVGTVSMIVAAVLTLYSLFLYLQRYGILLIRNPQSRWTSS